MGSKGAGSESGSGDSGWTVGLEGSGLGGGPEIKPDQGLKRSVESHLSTGGVHKSTSDSNENNGNSKQEN